MMFVLGESDTRTPPGAGGEEMFRALKFRKVPTVMVKFPGESHELSRSGSRGIGSNVSSTSSAGSTNG